MIPLGCLEVLLHPSAKAVNSDRECKGLTAASSCISCRILLQKEDKVSNIWVIKAGQGLLYFL